MAKLFEEWNLGSLKLRNRIVIPPMCQYSAMNGVASSWHLIHLGKLSHSGAGLLIVEATAVEAIGRISYGDLGIYNDECELSLTNIIKEIKKYSNIPIAIQLAHAGRKASTQIPWLGQGQISPDHSLGWQTVSATTRPYNLNDHLPLELTTEELHALKNSFRLAAIRSVNAGFDAIELHAAHGYLLHQFLSPLTNIRKDEYGGSFENRIKFPLEVFSEIKKSVPNEFPIWVRISATDWFEDGWNIEESVLFCKELKKLGSVAIHVSSGGLDPNQKIKIEPHYQVEFAKRIKSETNIPTICVGLITDPIKANEIIATEKVDAVAIGREILRNPNWPWAAAKILNEKIIIPNQYLRAIQTI